MEFLYKLIASLIVRLNPQVYATLFVVIVSANAVIEALISYDVIAGGVWQTVVMVLSGLLALLTAPELPTVAEPRLPVSEDDTQNKRDKMNATQG